MTPSATPHRGLSVPLVSVAGTPDECGRGYGVAAAAAIAANLERYARRFRDQASLDDAAVRVAGARFREVTAALHPRVAAMLDGVADGAGVPAAALYALNARTELLYDAALGPAAGEGAGREGIDGGCTAIGVLGSHTVDGHLWLAQNWDWHPDQRDTTLLLATRDERGHAVLALTEAGMLAKTGLNSAGLGVCVNLLTCDRDGLGPPGAAPGVPYHVLLRAALEADGLGWALRAVCRSPRSASINLLLGQAEPAAELPAGGPPVPGPAGGEPAAGRLSGGGELIDLELVPGDTGWLHPRDGVLTHANHLESAVGVHDAMKHWGGSSLFRSDRARRLLRAAAGTGPVTPAHLAAVLRDHLGAPLAICRHVDDRDPPLERVETVYSVLLDLDARRLGLAAGPPCGGEYGWLDLATAVADRAAGGREG
ncbi:MAG TPA: C45 family peptidase [Pilimelia sp.]|nr:C45 family peptidase [Pilimelia sp.]